MWRFYLYVLASAGLFLVAWVYLTARALAPSGPRAKYVGWAVASLFPPFGCLMLFELCRLVARVERRRSRARDSAIMPPLWFALLAIVVTVTPLRRLFIAHVALLTLPCLAVQARINRLHERFSVPVLPTRRSPAFAWAVVGLTVGGLAGSAWLCRRVDRVDYQYAFARTVGDRPIQGTSGLFRMVSPPSWIRLASGAIGSSSSDLELARADGTANIVVYVSGARTLDHAVTWRRHLIADSQDITGLSEARSFLTRKHLEPASFAHYDVGRFPRHRFSVMTIAATNATFEVVAWSATPEVDDPIIQTAFLSFEIVGSSTENDR